MLAQLEQTQNLIFILPDIVKRLDFQQRPDISQL